VAECVRHECLTGDVQDHEVRIRVLEVDNTENKAAIRSLCKMMDRVDANTTWILRLIVGAIVLAVLGQVIVRV